MGYRILIADDEAEIRDLLRLYLEKDGYEVLEAADGLETMESVKRENPDLLLLDIMMPGLDGYRVLRNIRETNNIPVIMLSAKGTNTDKILGLDLGADDYITKPFSVVEVLARIKANIRRATQYDSTRAESETETALLTAGDLAMNLADYTVTKRGSRVELTAKEFEILKLLLQNPKKVYTKEQLYSLVWNDAYLGDENAVNVHISRLRNKIEDDSRNPRYVVTVWGIGYKLGEVT